MKPGPKTPEGKRRSSMNALKHGLHATSPQAMASIAERIDADYAETLRKMRLYYQPMDPVEDELVSRIARCVWRLAITSGMEERQLGLNPVPGKPSVSYEKILRLEILVDIHLHRAIHTLLEKRAAEKSSHEVHWMKPESRY